MRIKLVWFFVILLRSRVTADILEKYPPGVADIATVSCRGKCGRTGPVCSCKSKCQILKNCCEDFAEVCPEELENKDTIEHLFGSSFTCYNHVFMITSCPTQNESSVTSVTSSIMPQSTPTSWRPSLVTPDGKRNPTFGKLLERPPVTDLYSGLTFLNATLFGCNSVNQSDPVQWITRMRPFNLDTASSRMNLESILDTSVEMYIPPTSATKAIRDTVCKNGSLSARPSCSATAYQKCRDFVTYIKTINYYFNNIYCMACYEELGPFENIQVMSPSTELSKWKTMGVTSLSLLMSLGDGNLVFRPSAANSIRNPAWIKAIYHVSIVDEANPQHWSYTCRRRAVKTKDGKCKYEMKFRFGVVDLDRDNGKPLSMTLDRLDSIPSIASCIIETLADTEVIIDKDQDGLIPPFQFYDDLLERHTYVFEINVFSEWQDITLYTRIFKIFDIASKAILEHFTRSSGETAVDGATKIRTIGDIAKSETSFKVMTDINYPQFLETIKGLEGLTVGNECNGSNINACLCNQLRGRDLIFCDLICWNSPRFDTDAAEIEYLLSSPCFVASPSAFHHAGPSLILASMLLVVVCLNGQ